MIALISSPIQGHKIPVWEQELSCGAVAMNLLHAANALGYVGGWITGWQAYSPRVTEAFCREGERIAGFIFLGTPGKPARGTSAADARRMSAMAAVRKWQADREAAFRH